ncbi:uncharacterized protein CLAFUR5_04935 [Fulvia fulva]|uniref:Uncharacterized protein n=1 Tax=Passalora fulva TaxID=5499 RepID=A0A9Q8LGI0_PASFU|nr:uncharacterized protein CLAFUR5_04935 [Fulvia fulva]KAK4617394.1 hypothetical protein CLAFUR0_10324 [Fulvia fulva]UJO16977.1 hypothetical protein CLAFUR5_04935 [Fulvia fulva]
MLVSTRDKTAAPQAFEHHRLTQIFYIEGREGNPGLTIEVGMRRRLRRARTTPIEKIFELSKQGQPGSWARIIVDHSMDRHITMSRPTQSTTTTQTSDSSLPSEVFAIPEILEMILLDSVTPALQLFALQRVDKPFQGTIAGSRKLQRKMCLEPSEDRKADTVWRHLGFQSHKQGKRTLTRVKLPVILNVYKSSKVYALDVGLPEKNMTAANGFALLEEEKLEGLWKNMRIGGEEGENDSKLIATREWAKGTVPQLEGKDGEKWVELRVWADKKVVSSFWPRNTTLGEMLEEVKQGLSLITVLSGRSESKFMKCPSTAGVASDVGEINVWPYACHA